MKTSISASLFLAMILCGSLHAHRDTILTLKGDKLEGLPKKYQPASFSFKTRRLVIGANSVVIPDALWKLFGDTKKNKIEFLASWYHLDIPLLPPYLDLGNKNCELLINLDTLEIIEGTRNKKITPTLLKKWKVTKTKAAQNKKGAPRKPQTE